MTNEQLFRAALERIAAGGDKSKGEFLGSGDMMGIAENALQSAAEPRAPQTDEKGQPMTYWGGMANEPNREHPTTDPATAYRTTCNHPADARGLTGCLLCGAPF